MENLKLLEKHAQMQGVDPAEMMFGNTNDNRNANHLDEDIVTAEDYLDDYEEEAAQRIIKDKDQFRQ
jgi:hypothetical protein|tara:strand:- start:180 stop:380 length:201 start_codon:yes stop_codon:yes gene_type:complete